MLTKLRPRLQLPIVEHDEYPEPLVLGNNKLGDIPHFALPAISTCWGRSSLCEELCYACKGNFLWSNVQQRHSKNHSMRANPEFIRRMLSQVRRKKFKEVRVHTSGDFDKISYIQKWIKIANRCPDTVFWAYTRSWRVKSLLPRLVELSRLPNFQMWWSCDKETGAPPRYKGIKRAYMAIDDQDIPKMQVDLVFRVCRQTRKITIANTLVCPRERDEFSQKVTCENCRICFDDKRLRWLDKFNTTHEA